MKVIVELIAYLDSSKLLSNDDIQTLETLGYYGNNFDLREINTVCPWSNDLRI